MKKKSIREWLLLQIPKIKNSDFKTALTYAFLTFLVLRVFTSLVLLIGHIHPPPGSTIFRKCKHHFDIH